MPKIVRRVGRPTTDDPALPVGIRLRKTTVDALTRDGQGISAQSRLILEAVADVLAVSRTVKRISDSARSDLRSYLASLGFHDATLDFLTELTVGVGALIEEMFVENEDGSLTLTPLYPTTDEDGNGNADLPVTVKNTTRRVIRVRMSDEAAAAHEKRKRGRPRKPPSIFERKK